MEEYQIIIDRLIEQENTLQFTQFNHQIALKIGMDLVHRAQLECKKVAIDIKINGQQVFFYAFEGTSPDNSAWVERKCNVVNRFYKSSYRVGIELKAKESTIDRAYYVDPMVYSAHGGCFPVRVKGVGVIGTITVSGLPQDQDHQMVVDAIAKYLHSHAQENV